MNLKTQTEKQSVSLQSQIKMGRKEDSKMNIAIIHPDLGIGGAERLIVDAAVELASQGHKVHVFTSHHDKSRCFEETLSGMADMILVNSNFTASTFAKTFERLHARGSRPAVLYPAVNIAQFNEPHAYKYCISLNTKFPG
ncbi:unnamed protein product [Thlaspi arvense]|uniref:Alpha-1,3/1,6-mannosyltransferase ALG2 n=1 Tax=Thlaspi arvense TaxID=13288 RepID=A0AAU9SJU6_THLAR|nr:unnamed protein product [Thlaspi arvense]